MENKQIQALINRHIRKINALELQLTATSRLAANPQASIPAIECRLNQLAESLETERDLLFLLESGDIQSYEDICR